MYRYFMEETNQLWKSVIKFQIELYQIDRHFNGLITLQGGITVQRFSMKILVKNSAQCP